MSKSLVGACVASGLILGVAAFAVPSAAQPATDSARIADTIKADVAQLIAGINAHDAARATAHDAPDVVSMECGRPSSIGIDADMAGLKLGFAANPDWRVSLVDETVDVASAGDMAIYRATYNQDNSQSGVPLTQKVNFLAGFKRQSDGTWKIGWYIVSPVERSHKK